MNIDTEKEKICINKIVQEKNDIVTIEGDSIVPDVKPDVITSINTCGNICIYKKEVLDGKIRIDGSVEAYVVYLTESEDGIVRGLNTTLDFTHTIEVEKCTSEMNLELNSCLKNIECKVLNGRKINLKANIEFSVRRYENREEEIIREIVGVENVQKQNKILKINSLIGRGSTKVIAKDTLTINENDNLGEILKVNSSIINKEYKMSYNKILIKAETMVKIMYLTEENTINSIDANIPIMGFIDIPNVSEEDLCDINYLLKNMLIKPNSTEEHSIYVEFEIDVEGSVYNTKDIEVVEDLYNPDYNINFTTKNIDAIADKNKCAQTVNINEEINLENVQSSRIFNVDTTTVITNTNIVSDKIICEGELNLNILFESNNSTGIDNKNITIPFSSELNTGRVSNSVKINTNVEVKSQSIIMNNGNVEIKMELELMANLYRTVELRIIDTLDMEEYTENNTSGMTIYFVKQGDSLWKIAKKFRTTVEEIRRVNQIEESSRIDVGQQLFITKYNSNTRKKLA